MTASLLAEILIAFLGFCGTFAGAYYANKKQTALMEYRLEQLEKKVEVHNNLIDRMYKVEADVKVINEELNIN